MLNYLNLGVGGVLGALVVTVPVYLYGKAEGRRQVAIEALEVTVEVLTKRREINNEINSADASDLCSYLGLSDSDVEECVRRLREVNTKSID